MENQFLQEIEYKIEETGFGTWKRFGYANGTSFHEFRSHSTFMGLPLVHYTSGRCPETGKRVRAKGIIAVGRFAVGLVAVGQVSFGLLAVGQLALGIFIGLGQLCTGLFGLGQFAVAALIGIGQFSTGYVAIGQFGLGKYVLAQMGFGDFVCSVARADPEAIEFFKSLPIVGLFFSS